MKTVPPHENASKLILTTIHFDTIHCDKTHRDIIHRALRQNSSAESAQFLLVCITVVYTLYMAYKYYKLFAYEYLAHSACLIRVYEYMASVVKRTFINVLLERSMIAAK